VAKIFDDLKAQTLSKMSKLHKKYFLKYNQCNIPTLKLCREITSFKINIGVTTLNYK
jgi:hypothetical protein